MMIWFKENPWQEIISFVYYDQDRLQTWDPVSTYLYTWSDQNFIFLSAVPPPVTKVLYPIHEIAFTAAVWQ